MKLSKIAKFYLKNRKKDFIDVLYVEKKYDYLNLHIMNVNLNITMR